MKICNEDAHLMGIPGTGYHFQGPRFQGYAYVLRTPQDRFHQILLLLLLVAVSGTRVYIWSFGNPELEIGPTTILPGQSG